MNFANPNNGSFSADVQMELRVNGRTYSIGQLGPDFLILDDPADHAPAQGEITVAIEGRIRRWSVQLPDGIVASRPVTRIAEHLARNGAPTG
jgi:hypothetical protein